MEGDEESEDVWLPLEQKVGEGKEVIMAGVKVSVEVSLVGERG